MPTVLQKDFKSTSKGCQKKSATIDSQGRFAYNNTCDQVPETYGTGTAGGPKGPPLIFLERSRFREQTLSESQSAGSILNLQKRADHPLWAGGLTKKKLDSGLFCS